LIYSNSKNGKQSAEDNAEGISLDHKDEVFGKNIVLASQIADEKSGVCCVGKVEKILCTF
jgi:hypothetical protein